MKPEERLFDLIGSLPDDLTAQTKASKRKQVTAKQRNRWIGAAAAACLLIAVGVYSASRSAPGPALNWPLHGGSSDNAELSITMLPVNDRVAEYHQVENPRAIPKEQRPRHLGEPYLDLENWYLPADTSNLRYLVHEEEDGSCTLWEFSSFAVLDRETRAELSENLEDSLWSTVEWFSLDLNFDPYPYSEVLETIYGVTGPADILSVTADPATMDNTDDGKKLQKEIGSFTISDRAALDDFYAAVSDSPCYGSDNWELIDLGETDPDGGLSNWVRLGRYLTIETKYGTINTLKYSAAGGQFYEFSGIAYEPLDAELAVKMNEIFKIEP